jgi:hypothetical protein
MHNHPLPGDSVGSSVPKTIALWGPGLGIVWRVVCTRAWALGGAGRLDYIGLVFRFVILEGMRLGG